MKEIYTPKEWYAIFGGSPSLVIDDQGYIYEAREYNNLMPRPCGMINYAKGEIYGKDYNDWSPSPIAYVREKNGVKEIYEKRPEASLGATPFLYINKGEIYTRDEYYKVFGGDASGYVKEEPKTQTGQQTTNKENSGSSFNNTTPKGNSRGKFSMPDIGGDASGCGCFLVICAGLFLGQILDSIERNPLGFLLTVSIVLAVMFVAAKLGIKIGYKLRKMRFGTPEPPKKTKKTRQAKQTSWSNTEKTNQQYNTTTRQSTTAQRSTSSKQSANTQYKAPMQYAHRCPVCGKAYNSTVKSPADLRCDDCKKATAQCAQNAAAQQEKEPATQTCKVCGKQFPAYVNKSTGICMECTAKAQNEQPKTPVIYTHHCPRCGKAYKSTLQNPESKYCDACYKLMQEEKATAEKAKQKQGYVQYAHRCPVCGKAYSSAEQNPANLRCDTCKTVAVQEEKTSTTQTCKVCGKQFPTDVNKSTGICMECTGKEQQTNSESKQQEQPKTEEKKIFTCPNCGAQNRVPAGKGRIVITCGNRDCRTRFVVHS
ncbi:MAG: hypothetical protein IJ411_04040 [Oscillospiraceae bacterium]|nr:hypothetical protein [Oscillospiraceae bacterium]